MDNNFIADQFDMLAKLMDIHGENTFKIRSYSNAVYTIEKLPRPLTEMSLAEMTAVKNIGDAIGKKILDTIKNGELPLLREFISKTPPGIIEMLGIKGLGPKKIITIWKEMEVESIGELLYACQENRLLLFKGFGEKTQNNVRESIEFFFKSQGSHLYADVETHALSLTANLQEYFINEKIELTGAFRRNLEIIDRLQWVTTASPDAAKQFFEANGFSVEEPGANKNPGANEGLGANTESPKRILFKGPEGINGEFIFTRPENFAVTLLETSCSNEFLEAWQQRPNWDRTHPFAAEEDIFSAHSLPFIPPYRREQATILEKAEHPDYVQVSDIRAIIHSHSTWSDGSNSLEEMAKACIDKGFEYLVISDHSKSAGYANGLKEDRIKEQHQLIETLNTQLAPFVIFKSIECDILGDSTLDYTDNILSTFDLVIASVHSNIKMNEEKAMMRLLRAIENPYTTILGHLTGRLLLSRPGYPVDHKKIIDACAENKVVLELNAHPRRLDIDWRWIHYALEKNVLISIDPDAHSTKGYKDIKYGVLAAQKAGLTPEKNLSSFSLAQFQAFLAARKKARGI
ncbi:PHP domain-containing protein [Flavitalea flava]